MSETGKGKWSDLKPRVFSAVIMLVVGALGIWAGGLAFHLLLSVVCGVMVWELARMLGASDNHLALWLGAASAIALFIASYAPAPGLILPLLLAPGLVGFGQLARGKSTFMVYGTLIVLAGFALISLRDEFGILWMCWLLVVVIVSDIAGYFAGKMIGGPKFWPRVSPNKTWSGTIAGWVGAAAVGIVFMVIGAGDLNVLGISVAASMAAQMGDIGESAIKRRMQVKDSSNIIPGHGGLLDRFDGMIGAAILLAIVGQFIAFPPVVG